MGRISPIFSSSPPAVFNPCQQPVASLSMSSAGEKGAGGSFVHSPGPGGTSGGSGGKRPPPSLWDRLKVLLRAQGIGFSTHPIRYYEEQVGPNNHMRFARDLEMMAIELSRDNFPLLFAHNPLSASFEQMTVTGPYIRQKRDFVLGLLRRFLNGAPFFQKDDEFRQLEDFLFDVIAIPEQISVDLIFGRDGKPFFFDVHHANTFLEFFCRGRPFVDVFNQYKFIRRGEGYIIDSYYTGVEGQDDQVHRIIQSIPDEGRIAVVQLCGWEYIWLATYRVGAGLLHDFRLKNISGYSRDDILAFTPPVLGFVDEEGNIPEFPPEFIRRREGLRRAAHTKYAVEDPEGELRMFYAGVQAYELLALQLARKLLDELK